VRYATLANGIYPLIRTTGGVLTGDPAALRLEGFVTLTQTARLLAAPGGNGLDLIVEDYIHTPRDLVWAGDGASNRWENGGSAVWLADGLPAAFFATDRVIFDASGAANPFVTLHEDLVPHSIRVNAEVDYTFAGTGSLLGPAPLLKSGSGRLIIEGDHGFSGGTSIAQGGIEVRSSTALGSGAVENSGLLAFAGSQEWIFANPVSGTGAIQQLSGETTLTAANSFVGPVTVRGGTLRAGNPMALGSVSGATTVNTGAVLDLAGIALAAEPVTLTGGVLVNSSSIEATLAGPLTVANEATLPAHGPIMLAGGLHGTASLSVEGALTLGGASTHSGNLTVSPGGSLRVTGHSGPGATTISAGALLRGSGTLGGPVTVAGSLETETTPGTLAFGDDLTLQPGAVTRLRIVKSSGGLVADRLQVAGTLSRNGELAVSISGLPLADGDTMWLLDAGFFAGDFNKIRLPRLSNNLVWDAADFASSGVLRVVTLPAISTTDQRRQWLLHENAANPGSIDNFVTAAAWFELGEEGYGAALALSRSRSLVDKIRSNPVQVDLFDMWPAVDLCARHGDKLDSETRSNIREATTTFTQYKDTNTSNLQTLAWVTRYLAGQVFGEAAFSSLGIANYWRTHDVNAAQQILTNLNDCTRLGFREHASRPYYAKNLQPILSLAQLATDPAMRQRAALAYEAGLAQNAASWLRGHLGAPTSRSYPDVLAQLPISSLGMLWYHFGGNLPPRNNEAAVFAAVMNQPVSPILETAATDRSSAFTSRSFLRNAHHSAYVDPDCILFSDGPRSVGNFQVYPNGVVWAEPDTSRYSFLWVAKPFRDDSGINSSNPHGRNTGQYKETQSRDAALYIYNIPSGDAFPLRARLPARRLSCDVERKHCLRSCLSSLWHRAHCDPLGNSFHMGSAIRHCLPRCRACCG
jgi:autotransporter-associated beta strand protein